MSLFPIKYKPQENSNIKKYYQVNTSGNLHLEREIILKHLLRQQTDSIPEVIAEDTEFANNLMITDINCSINNPTAFCFLSTYVELPPAMNNYSYTSLIGVNNYDNMINNQLTTTIQLDETNSPIFDTDLLITVTNGATTFYNQGEQAIWSATFASDAKQMLQIAVNSGYYGEIGPLQITEDIIFNTNFALGNSKSAFYTEDAVTKRLNSNNTIATNYLSATNNLLIQINNNNFTDNSFGSFKIEQLESSLDVKYQPTGQHTNEPSNFISNNYIIRGETNDDTVALSSIDVLSKYTDLTLDTSENNSVKIEISNINPTSGLNFTNSDYNTYFTFNNAPMINNNNFMENVIYPNAQMQFEITQQPMTITSANESTPEYELLTLSTNGESLDINEYDKDGQIILQVVPNADRCAILSASNNYKDINVDYSILSNSLKTNQYVDYNINNLIGNTSSYAADAVANNAGDNASVFTNTNLSDYTNIQLTNSYIKDFIDPTDENIVMIKVNPLTLITNNLLNNYLYIENTDTGNADLQTSVSVSVNVSLSGNISSLLNYDDLRFIISQKKLSDVFSNYSISEPNLRDTVSYTISETNLTTATNTFTSVWTVGYSDNNQNLLTSTEAAYAFNYKEIDINKNFLSLNIYFYMRIISGICNEYYYLSGDLDSTKGIESKSGIFQMIVPNTPTYTTYSFTSRIVAGNGSFDRVVIDATIIKYVNYSINVKCGLYNNITLKTPTMLLKEVYSYTYFNVSSYTISPDNTSITVINTKGDDISTSQGRTSLRGSMIYLNTFGSVPISLINENMLVEPINVNNQMKFTLNMTLDNTYPVFTNIEARNKNQIGYTPWAPITEQKSINPYETYFFQENNDYTIILNNDDYNISIDLSFEELNGMEFVFETKYFMPLILNKINSTTNTEITGYKYSLNDLRNTFTNLNLQNFTPQYFTNTNVGLLQYGTNISGNLSFRIENSNEDPTQGMGTYAASMKIYYTENDVTNLISTINIDSPNFNSPIVIYRNSNNFFNVTRTINNNSNNALQYKLFGTNDITDANKGTITLYDDVENTIIDGVSVNYDSIKKSNAITFSLNPDKISVKLAGTNSLQPSAIDRLVYTQTGCESLTIPYYRGYYFVNNAQNLGATYTYTINRQNLVSYKVTAFDANTNTTFTSDTTNPAANSSYTIVFDNAVGSIGATIIPVVSRMPTNMLTLDNNTKLNIPISVSSDEVTITRTILEVDYVEVKLLKEYILRTFENGKTLRVLNLRATNSVVNDYYALTCAKSSTRVSYSNIYKGDPTTISIWNELINLPFNETKFGVTFDEQGDISENGFLKITVSNETVPGSVTYFVVAPPYLFAKQMDVDGLQSLTNNSNVDLTKLVTKYFPVTSQNAASTYNPFSGIDSLNNITFTQQNYKKYADYLDNAVTVSPFNVTGSSVEIKEVLPESETGTESGPQENGIIFNGYITDLIDMSIENQYKDYINVDTSTFPILRLSYTQQNQSLSFFNPDAQPINNIHFNISGLFITNDEYRLNSSTDKGSQISIFDMVKQENDVVLLKYNCQPIDYTNIPREMSPNEIIFSPTKVYTSVVNLPTRIFGDKYPDVFSRINYTHMNLNNNDDIIWTELTGSDAEEILNNFSLKIAAINSDGLNNIIECLFTTSEITQNFTVINQKNAFELLSTDETPLMIISPFGQINTSNINTKVLTFFKNAKNNVDLFETTENLLN